MSRQAITNSLRAALLAKHNNCCVSCGISNEEVPLEVAFLVSISHGGDPSEENATLLCPNCHRTFDQEPVPREFEFVAFIAELLQLNPAYQEVRKEVVLGTNTRYRADIVAKHIERGQESNILVECKTRLANRPQLTALVSQLEQYSSLLGECTTIVAVPTTIRESLRSDLSEAGIEVWDLDFIASTFSSQIFEARTSYYRTLLLAKVDRSGLSRETELMSALDGCRPGKEDWQVYQSLVGDILEFLFTPPLGKPISELSDFAQANRRDFVIPNYSESGFWSFMRDKYEADYIVVDAKNYVGKVHKPQILQIANYLKSHGAGLFGLILSRIGGDSAGCEHSLREQWLMHKKLILVLDDDDVKEMLVANADGRPPHEVISQKIERFRLSV